MTIMESHETRQAMYAHSFIQWLLSPSSPVFAQSDHDFDIEYSEINYKRACRPLYQTIWAIFSEPFFQARSSHADNVIEYLRRSRDDNEWCAPPESATRTILNEYLREPEQQTLKTQDGWGAYAPCVVYYRFELCALADRCVEQFKLQPPSGVKCLDWSGRYREKATSYEVKSKVWCWRKKEAEGIIRGAGPEPSDQQGWPWDRFTNYLSFAIADTTMSEEGCQAYRNMVAGCDRDLEYSDSEEDDDSEEGGGLSDEEDEYGNEEEGKVRTEDDGVAWRGRQVRSKLFGSGGSDDNESGSSPEEDHDIKKANNLEEADNTLAANPVTHPSPVVAATSSCIEEEAQYASSDTSSFDLCEMNDISENEANTSEQLPKLQQVNRDPTVSIEGDEDERHAVAIDLAHKMRAFVKKNTEEGIQAIYHDFRTSTTPEWENVRRLAREYFALTGKEYHPF